jgi:hypothetical protein
MAIRSSRELRIRLTIRPRLRRPSRANSGGTCTAPCCEWRSNMACSRIGWTKLVWESLIKSLKITIRPNLQLMRRSSRPLAASSAIGQS